MQKIKSSNKSLKFWRNVKENMPLIIYEQKYRKSIKRFVYQIKVGVVIQLHIQNIEVVVAVMYSYFVKLDAGQLPFQHFSTYVFYSMQKQLKQLKALRQQSGLWSNKENQYMGMCRLPSAYNHDSITNRARIPFDHSDSSQNNYSNAVSSVDRSNRGS